MPTANLQPKKSAYRPTAMKMLPDLAITNVNFARAIAAAISGPKRALDRLAPVASLRLQRLVVGVLAHDPWPIHSSPPA